MKAILISMLVIFSTFESGIEPMKIGDKAPKTDLTMLGTDGKETTLNDLKKDNGLCVIFSCNTCPYVIGWENRYNELEQLCAKYNIGFVLVNSNEAKREGADSMENMKEHAQEKGYNEFAYLVDENHVLADAFGATKTPDVFLFNGAMQLIYKGAIDDNMKNRDKVSEPYLKNALNAIVSGVVIDPNETKSIGCSIKRKS